MMTMLSSTAENARTSAMGDPLAPMKALCETQDESRFIPTGRAARSISRKVRKLAVSLTE